MSGLKMKYFILKPMSKKSNDIYAQASRKAMRVYANHIQAENKQLADELKEWVEKETIHELEMKEADGILPKFSSFEDSR